jgi:hypothetical protein
MGNLFTEMMLNVLIWRALPMITKMYQQSGFPESLSYFNGHIHTEQNAGKFACLKN